VAGSEAIQFKLTMTLEEAGRREAHGTRAYYLTFQSHCSLALDGDLYARCRILHKLNSPSQRSDSRSTSQLDSNKKNKIDLLTITKIQFKRSQAMMRRVRERVLATLSLSTHFAMDTASSIQFQQWQKFLLCAAAAAVVTFSTSHSSLSLSLSLVGE
jgi:hypothetical protein